MNNLIAGHHDLKTWPEFYKDVETGAKRFELRKNDRDFKVGDTLVLREWDPAKLTVLPAEPGDYTGKAVRVKVTYMISGPKFGLEAGHCILGFKMLPSILKNYQR